MLIIRRTVVLFLMFLFATGICQDLSSVISPNFIFETLALNRDIPTKAYPKYISPIALIPSPDKKKLYIAEQTAKRIAIFDVENQTVEKMIQLPNEVTGLAVSPDGSKIYATCSSDLWPAGFVCEVDIAVGKVINRIAAGYGSRSPNITPDGKTLYVCNTYSNDISVIDIASAKEQSKIGVIREPFASKITPDGKTLIVANSLPHEKAIDSLTITNKIQFINTATNHVTDTIPLTVGSHSAFGMTISPDGKYAFVSHLIGMFNRTANKIEGGWVHTNNLAIIDIAEKKAINDVTYDYAKAGAGNPWGVAASEDSEFMCAVTAGSNELYVFKLNEFINLAVENAKKNLSLSRDFTTFPANIDHKRVVVEGKSPRAVAIIGDKVYTAGYFSDSLEIYSLNTSRIRADMRPVAKIELGPAQTLTSHRYGEFLFNDASVCTEKWQSCASCHPFGRPDALNWILNSDASAPKNAKSMLYSWWTPPTNWAAKRRNGFESVRTGIEAELFRTPTDDIAVPIDSFMVRMKPVPSPYLVKGMLSDAAKRGRELYYNKSKLDCILCHPAPLFTDGGQYTSGVEDFLDMTTNYWDTPSLIEGWRSAPYNHLGSNDKIEDIIRLPGHSPKGFSGISESEFKDLVEYVLSL